MVLVLSGHVDVQVYGGSPVVPLWPFHVGVSLFKANTRKGVP